MVRNAYIVISNFDHDLYLTCCERLVHFPRASDEFYIPIRMDVVVAVTEGKIRGKRAVGLNGASFYSFQGIPYAKPPVGDLRFKAPRPHEKWSGVKDCTEEGPASFARHMIYSDRVIGSEDCLILNVFTKNNPQTAANIPVMVWIHGGGFLTGSSNYYGPDFFMTKDVVLVTINYRIGILGFLAFDDHDLGVPGNAGLKDQVMALKWVQANIKNFGGDPGNITIFGESAGACCVHYLVLSPMAKGLFHKAILQSGSALCPWSIANNCLNNILDNLHCPYTNEKDVLRFLQEQPVEKLFEAQDKLGDHLPLNARRDFGPIIEKPSTIEPNFITKYPIEILKNGLYNKIPMIIGYTSAEGLLLYYYHKFCNNKLEIVNSEEVVPNTFNLKFGSDQSKKVAEQIKKFYFGNEEPSAANVEKLLLMHGDLFFVFGIQQSADLHSNTSSEPVYLYRFSVEGNRNLYKIMIGLQSPGTSHGDDLAYLFHMDFPEFLNRNKITPNSIEEKTIARMIELWTNFAKTGNPNSTDIDIVWKPITKDDFNFIEIGHSLSVGTFPDGDRMKFCTEMYNSATNST